MKNLAITARYDSKLFGYALAQPTGNTAGDRFGFTGDPLLFETHAEARQHINNTVGSWPHRIFEWEENVSLSQVWEQPTYQTARSTTDHVSSHHYWLPKPEIGVCERHLVVTLDRIIWLEIGVSNYPDLLDLSYLYCRELDLAGEIGAIVKKKVLCQFEDALSTQITENTEIAKQLIDRLQVVEINSLDLSPFPLSLPKNHR
jgi:hypothetical protein